MQAFIKDKDMIINSMILEDEKDKLIDYVNKYGDKYARPTTLYDVNGNKSGVLYTPEENIKVITDATALPPDIAKGKVAYGNNGERIVGTNEDLGNKATLNLDTSIKIQSGNGSKIGAFIEELPSINLTNYISSVIGNGNIRCYSLDYLFCNCSKLKNISNIKFPAPICDLGSAFYNCSSLISIPELDCSMSNGAYNTFVGCTSVVDFGGLKNYGKSYTVTSNHHNYYTLDLSSMKLLTYESAMNVINKLYDLNLTYNVANGGTLYRQYIRFHKDVYNKLSANDRKIAEDKGWDVKSSG